MDHKNLFLDLISQIEEIYPKTRKTQIGTSLNFKGVLQLIPLLPFYQNTANMSKISYIFT